jgi:L-asparaginase
LWLHKKYNLSVQEAVTEVITYSNSTGAVRRPTTDAVLRILGKVANGGSGGSKQAAPQRPPPQLAPEGIPPKSARGAHTPRLPGSYGSKSSSGNNGNNGNNGDESIFTPRSSRPLPKPRIAFVQTGGTIDKEYPQSTKGYAFEIAGDCPAVRRVLKDASHVPLGFHTEFHEVCRKDSTELTNQDRALLVSTLVNDVVRTDRIIITHGSDTIIETADFISRDDRLKNKTIVLTGSMRPQKFRDTDAAFNIGVAVGAVHILPPGVYVAMCGAVISHERCRRDMKTGAFVAVP